MDLVVISPDLFNRTLESFAHFCFERLRNEPDLKSDSKSKTDKVSLSKDTLLAIRRRSKTLFYGYVSPSDLQDGTPEKQDFYNMQREASTQLFGTAPPGPINRIGARIYRDWDSAERAYEFSFRQLAEKWGIASGEPDLPNALDDGKSDGVKLRSQEGHIWQ